MQNIQRESPAWFLPAMAAAIAILASSASAEEPLRWKFEKGAKYDYDMTQNMTISSTGGPGGPQNVTMNQDLKMTWDIQDVTKEGNAIIQQKIESVKMKMALPPPVGAIEYDSTSEKPPAGPAAMLAPMYGAMMKGAFTITMTPQGEIKDVKIPEEIVAALKNSPGAAAMGDMASPEGFKKMIKQGSLKLPDDAPTEGKEWTESVEVAAAAGKQIVENSYKFVGMKEVDGIKFAQFKPKVQMKFEGAQVKIAKQESDGEILFNVTKGRLDSSKLEQHVTLEQSGVQTQIDQEIAVTVKPAGEAASEKSAEKAAADGKN